MIYCFELALKLHQGRNWSWLCMPVKHRSLTLCHIKVEQWQTEAVDFRGVREIFESMTHPSVIAGFQHPNLIHYFPFFLSYQK